LTQGEKFIKYQNKIVKNLEKRIEYVNSKEGFENSLPNSLKHYMTSLSIPIFPGLTFMQQRKVIKILTSVFSQSLNVNA
jgi:dTDP-4-amino-4,6-dideoxygalactose transaminase